MPFLVLVGAAITVTCRYVIPNGLFVFGLFGFAYIVYQSKPQAPSNYRFLLLAAVLLLPALLVGSASFLFLAAAAAVCFGIEVGFKRISPVAYVLLIVVSPISYYFFESFGFEIKLHITRSVVALLHLVNQSVVAEGNTVLIAGNRFSIDTACMGLRMTGYALALCLLLFFHFMQHRRYSVLFFILVLALTFLLNIAANFSRIVILIVFQILPQHPMHSIVGLICFVFYTIIPLLLVLSRLSKRVVLSSNAVAITLPAYRNGAIVQFVCALVLLLSSAYMQVSKSNNSTIRQLPHNYSEKVLDNGTIMLSHKSVLVYIKPINSFISSEHTPALCWVGSGYDISYINRIALGGRRIFYGILKKKDKELYTAWWIVYQNHQTINQFEWRKAMLLHAAPCCLINVTANTHAQLLQAIQEFEPVSY